MRGGGGLKLAMFVLTTVAVGGGVVVRVSMGAGIAKGSEEEVLICGGLGVGGRGLDAPKTSSAEAPPEVMEEDK